MSDTVWLALIAMLGASIANIATGILAYLKSRDAERSSQKALTGTDLNRIAIQEIHVAVNDRLTQLLAANALTADVRVTAAHAAGMIVGAQSARACPDCPVAAASDCGAHE